MLFDPGACCDCGSTSTICVVMTWRYCDGTLSTRNLPAGYTIRAVRTSDGFELASGVTNASGQVTICVPTGQTFQFILDGGAWFGTQTLTGGYVTPRTVTVQPLPTFVCAYPSIQAVCPSGPYFHYRYLTLTDANGSYSVDILSGDPIFSSKALGTMTVTDGSGHCVVSGGTLRYWYYVLRTSGGWRVTRHWDVRTLTGQPASGLCADTFGTAIADMTNGACPDVYVSGTPTSLDYPDPIGGGVVVSS
ncbi:hypothetical protein [Paludisphaera rhizosphaerae]|uniref:hypothetical protein n=1 Tax=Paludisphaera rhizosphaerae TaxID=2711216 RepID=UPI0013EA06E8|nr:hypothetical protein [Paludisphaera rhizosphaerae]